MAKNANNMPDNMVPDEDGATQITPASVQPQSDDTQTPTAPADPPTGQHLDETHQATDSNLDSHELYDEGLASAAEASDERNAHDNSL